MQTSLELAFTEVENVPALHIIQALAAASGPYVPASHASQWGEPDIFEKNPGEQEVQLDWPRDGPLVPGAHDWHVDAPGRSAKNPAPQGLQLSTESAPSVDENLPARHDVHLLAVASSFPL